MPRKHTSSEGNGEEPAPSTNEGGHSDSDIAMVRVDDFVSRISARLVAFDELSTRQVKLEEELSERVHIMIFTLNREHYALPLEHTVEVIKSPRVTPVPNVTDWLLGVTNLHGEIVSVVDLARFLQISERAYGEANTVLVTRAADQTIGLAVEQPGRIFSCPEDEVSSPVFEIPPGIVTYLWGVVEYEDDFIRLLDPERLLLGQQMQHFA